MKPKAVLAYCREKGIKAVDIRFPDGMGRWRHFSIPASSLTEGVFETGLGLEPCFSTHNDEEHTSWILVPVPDAKYLDPLPSEPTLVLMASIQDALTGEEAWFDPRSVSIRAVEAFRGTGLVDDLMVSSTIPFQTTGNSSGMPRPAHMADPHAYSLPGNAHRLAGGRLDPDARFRSMLLHAALDAGLAVERHYRGAQSSSEFLLAAKPLVQACDDHLLLQSLIETNAMQHELDLEQSGLLSKSAWTLFKGTDSLMGGSRAFGLSELGWYAAGGILKHSDAIAAIAASSPFTPSAQATRWRNFLSDRTADSLVGVEPMSNDPRYRALVYRNHPANSCPYLTLSAIAMAMLDGILQKTAPASENLSSPDPKDTLGTSKALLAKRLAEDSSFLMQAEVFSETLIEHLHKQLASSNT